MGLWVMVAMLRCSDLGHGSQWQVDVVGGGNGGFFFLFSAVVCGWWRQWWVFLGYGVGGRLLVVVVWVVGFWWVVGFVWWVCGWWGRGGCR